MRRITASFLLVLIGTFPALAGSQMKQSPALMRKAGAACTPGHRGPQRGAGYGYRLGGCSASGR